MQKKCLAARIVHQSQLAPAPAASRRLPPPALSLTPARRCHGRCLCKPCLILLTVAAATEQRERSTVLHCKKRPSIGPCFDMIWDYIGTLIEEKRRPENGKVVLHLEMEIFKKIKISLGVLKLY